MKNFFANLFKKNNVEEAANIVQAAAKELPKIEVSRVVGKVGEAVKTVIKSPNGGFVDSIRVVTRKPQPNKTTKVVNVLRTRDKLTRLEYTENAFGPVPGSAKNTIMERTMVDYGKYQWQGSTFEPTQARAGFYNGYPDGKVQKQKPISDKIPFKPSREFLFPLGK